MKVTQRFIPTDDLEIVGYAEVLRNGTTPRKVPPIFRFRADPSRFVFPPFRLIDEQVVNGTIGGEKDYRQLLANAQATPLSSPIPARPSSVLWIDENLTPHYGPQRDVLTELRALARAKYREAKAAFANSQFDEAQRLARHAFAADERLWLALALQAAVDRLRLNEDAVTALKSIASDLVDADDFEREVNNLISIAQAKDILWVPMRLAGRTRLALGVLDLDRGPRAFKSIARYEERVRASLFAFLVTQFADYSQAPRELSGATRNAELDVYDETTPRVPRTTVNSWAGEDESYRRIERLPATSVN